MLSYERARHPEGNESIRGDGKLEEREILKKKLSVKTGRQSARDEKLSVQQRRRNPNTLATLKQKALGKHQWISTRYSPRTSVSRQERTLRSFPQPQRTNQRLPWMVMRWRSRSGEPTASTVIRRGVVVAQPRHRSLGRPLRRTLLPRHGFHSRRSNLRLLQRAHLAPHAQVRRASMAECSCPSSGSRIGRLCPKQSQRLAWSLQLIISDCCLNL